ncbi:venom prothrombin activator vestarin-D1-like [Protopterus annectens]|uniref:venom prothrombin activator vestarin-D1-like n=1 Tax=Protopterus annectens TaxID=7888 RepID=UPI001CFA6669|nr:venom prothrombin activator vestarin-D1-like [Protopterus annectens]
MDTVLKYISLFLLQLLLCRCSASSLFLQKDSADQVLARVRRANAGVEEFYQGNLERECFEEICGKEEAREYFEDNGKTEAFWKNYTDVDECKSSPCLHNGTCQNTPGSFACQCTGGYEGQYCDADIDECTKFSPCPDGFQCVDGLNSFTCVCPDEGCLTRLKKIVT